MKRSNLTLAAVALTVTLSAWGEIPAGYYSSLEGKKQSALKSAAKSAARSHKRISYGNSTWEAFESTDTRAVNGELIWWDMYSDNEVTVRSGHPSMNIEHAVPNSWWGKTVNDAYCDLFHLNPSDATANNRKSNFPLGIVKTVTYTNGVTTVGKPESGACGGAPNVFEPADCYKGDFARAYFYMFTLYDDIAWQYNASDRNFMFDGQAYPSLKTWATTMLLEWAKEDPVDAKEIARNEAIYKEQGNRNPFIDYPDLADFIWGSRQNTPFTLAGDHTWSGSDVPGPGPDPDPDQPLSPAVSFPVADATAIDGTYYAEEPRTDTSNGQAERYQPLRSFTIGDYDFTFTSGSSTATAWYNVMSTATSGVPTLRLYNGSGMTVKAPEGAEIGRIVMNGSNANASLSVKSDRGIVTRDGNVVTWTGLGAEEVTFAFNATYRVESFDISTVSPAGVGEISDDVYSATAWTPAAGHITVTAFGTPVRTAAVYDMAGRMIGGGSLETDITLSVAPGIYIVTFSDGVPPVKVIVP